MQLKKQHIEGNGFSLEENVLLAAARLQAHKGLHSLLADHAQDVDWEVLVVSALTHGVTPLLCKNLLGITNELVPRPIMQACQSHLRQQMLSNQAGTQQLIDVLAQLKLAGIEALPFKGPTLAVKAYRDISLRTFRDLDFLIREADIERCLQLLRELGYAHERNLSQRQWREFLGYAGQDIVFGKGLPLEPHWAFAPRTLALDFDYDGLWERTSQIAFQGQAIASLSPEDELIVICVHGFKHRWRQLKCVVDLSEFLRQHAGLDWSRLMERARAQGLSRIVTFGLSLTQRLFNTGFPEEVTLWLGKDSYSLRSSQALADTYFETCRLAEPSIYETSRFHWSMRERPRDRWRYLLRTLTQPTERHFPDIAIPDRFFFLFFPYKIAHDYFALPLWTCIKALRKMVRKPPAKHDGEDRSDATG